MYVEENDLPSAALKIQSFFSVLLYLAVCKYERVEESVG